MAVTIRERRPITPLQRAAAAVHAANAPDAPRRKRKGNQPAIPPPDFGPKCEEPSDLSPPLLYQRERAYALCMALRLERWLLEHIAQVGIPLDNCLIVVTLLPIFVEAMLKARIIYPGYFPTAPEDHEDESEPEQITESDAVEMRLTIRRRPAKQQKEPANLPGCQGDGGACPKLRRYGARFCPSCERKERERIRADVNSV